MTRRQPAWVWVGAVVLVSSAVRYLFARHMVAPWIMIDEIVYSELAKSFAATGHFAIRGTHSAGYGYVYPILISPAYALFDSIPTAYTAVKAINSVLISLSAIPAYLLARRVLSQRGALAVAVLTVAVPSTFYAGTIMTENAFYPVFLLAALALVAALERPGFASAVVFLVVLGLAVETRTQAIALLPAALVAPLVLVALGRRRRDLVAHRALYGLVAGLAVVALGAEVARGRSPRSLLGAYAVTTQEHYAAGTVARWLLWHLCELTLYVGVVPVIALVVLARLGPGLAQAERVVIATTIALVGCLGLEVAAFATQPSVLRIEERNLFYVAPLLLTCLVLWVEKGLPRPRVTMPAAAAAAVGLVAAVPYERFIGVSATSDTFVMLDLWSVKNWLGIGLGDVRWLVAAGALVLVVVAFTLPRRAAFVLPGVVLLLYAAAAQPIDQRTQRASIGALFQGITRPQRDWISRIVGDADPSRVSVVWPGSAVADRLVVYENEFFNRDVGAIYTLAEPMSDGLAQSPLTLDPANGDYLAGGRPVRAQDLLTSAGVAIAGLRIGGDSRKGLVLLRVGGLLRAPYLVRGVYGDSWSGPTVTYHRWRCAGGVLTARIASDPRLFRRAEPITVSEQGQVVRRFTLPPSATRSLAIPLRARGGACDVTFRMGLTAVPARVESGSTDTRALGARFLAFGFEARG